MNPNLSELEESIGYRFRRSALLHCALTHSSFSQESREPQPHNERLEFLGDAILGLIVSERLVDRFPEHSEGSLTKLKAVLVSTPHLAKVARGLSLGSYFFLGRGEETTGGRAKEGLLANTLEAVIAAIYLDGGLAAARGFLDRHLITEDALTAAGADLDSGNYKSALQELLQARKMPPPSYEVVQESGPQHHKTFTIKLSIGTVFAGTAQGPSKKTAEQRVAWQALQYLREEAGSGRQ